MMTIQDDTYQQIQQLLKQLKESQDRQLAHLDRMIKQLEDFREDIARIGTD